MPYNNEMYDSIEETVAVNVTCEWPLFINGIVTLAFTVYRPVTLFCFKCLRVYVKFMGSKLWLFTAAILHIMFSKYY